jgi:hypothetical protein
MAACCAAASVRGLVTHCLVSRAAAPAAGLLWQAVGCAARRACYLCGGWRLLGAGRRPPKPPVAMESQRSLVLRESMGPAAAEPGLQHCVCRVDDYEQLLADKATRAAEVMRGIASLGSSRRCQEVALEVHPSADCHYRQRVDLWVRSDINEALPGSRLYYAMAPSSASPSSSVQPAPPAPEPELEAAADTARKDGVEVWALPTASLRVNQLMAAMMESLNAAAAGSVLRHRLYEARFLTTLAGAGPPLVTLIYHRHLGDAGVAEAWQAAASQLSAEIGGASIVGRSRGQQLVVGQPWVEEELELRSGASGGGGGGGGASGGGGEASLGRYVWRQAEGGFSQPNAAVCTKMLEFALSCTEGEPFASTDLLELHCGNANFTVINSPSVPACLCRNLCMFPAVPMRVGWYPSLRW